MISIYNTDWSKEDKYRCFVVWSENRKRFPRQWPRGVHAHMQPAVDANVVNKGDTIIDLLCWLTQWGQRITETATVRLVLWVYNS